LEVLLRGIEPIGAHYVFLTCSITKKPQKISPDTQSNSEKEKSLKSSPPHTRYRVTDEDTRPPRSTGFEASVHDAEDAADL